MMRSSILILLIAVSTVFAQNPAESKKPSILGEWFLVKDSTTGGELATLLKNNITRLTIDSESIVAGRTSAYKLDEAKNHIDLTIDGGPKAEQGTYSGIYELKGDSLKIHLAQPGQPRPTGFEAKNTTVLIVLTRGKG